MERDFIYLAEKLSLPIKQLIVTSPIAKALYTVATRDNWTAERFVEELALAFAKAYADFLAAEMQRQLASPVRQRPERTDWDRDDPDIHGH